MTGSGIWITGLVGAVIVASIFLTSLGIAVIWRSSTGERSPKEIDMDTNSRPRLLEFVESIIGDLDENRPLDDAEWRSLVWRRSIEAAMTASAKIDGLCDDVQSIASSLRIIAEEAERRRRDAAS